MLGAWFVIGVLPTPFEHGAHNAREIYKDTSTPGKVEIDFTFNKDALDGPVKSIPQKGYGWFDDKPNEWKVSPFWPIKLPYVMIEASDTAKLDADDAWCVIGYPSRSYCWIMARKPEMSEQLYNNLVDKLVDKHEYPADLKKNIIKVPHSWVHNASTGEYERPSTK